MDNLGLYPKTSKHPRTSTSGEQRRNIKFTAELLKQRFPSSTLSSLEHPRKIMSFKVYRKPSNKNDLNTFFFFLHHDSCTKCRVVVGFCLRGLRISNSSWERNALAFNKHLLLFISPFILSRIADAEFKSFYTIHQLPEVTNILLH